MGRKLKTHLDLLQPYESVKVRRVQAKQNAWHDRHTKVRLFSVGDRVYVLNFGGGNRWLGGTVGETFGSSLIVKLLDGQNVTRHVDHVRLSTCDVTSDVSGPSEPSVEANTCERPANIIPEGNTLEGSCKEPFQGAPAVKECEPPPPVAQL